MTIQIEHNQKSSRFEAHVDGQLCVAEYRLTAGIMQMTHTLVPPSLEGRGIAAQLVRAALAYAQAEGLRIDPVCSYVRAYMQRHPETASLLA